MKIAVVRFPGSNCDQDCLRALTDGLGVRAEYVWHKETSVAGYDAVILPGGFSYGDYLRCGAIAAFSPVMQSVIKAAQTGMPVFGICNGFQILCETGLLRGALIRNRSLLFLCQPVSLKLENNRTPFTRLSEEGTILSMPIAHGEGAYYARRRTRMVAGTTSPAFVILPGTFSELCRIQTVPGTIAWVAKTVCNYLDPWWIHCYQSRHDSHSYP